MQDLAARLQAALGDALHLERELPLGGLGRLFLATEARSGRQVVVQVLPPDIASRMDAGRFARAVAEVARLRHPAIVPLLGAGGDGDLQYVMLARPHGESLRGRLLREGGLPAQEQVQVLHDVADALAVAHEAGVYHGDLRADTIFLDNGRGYIAELGLRCALDLAVDGERTPDVRADIHALAVAGQHMLGGQPSRVDGVLQRALSIDPGEQFASAAAFRDALGRPPSEMRRRTRRRILTGGAVALIAASLVLREARQDQPLDPDLLVVAPFEILHPAHDYWQEGMVDVLAANLDGAGPLRTVPATLAVRRWAGRSDAASAVALGRRTGARLALFGRVVAQGGDTVAVSARLVDTESRAVVTELSYSDGEARLDRLADSLTIGLLRELSRTRPIGPVRRGSFGTSSLTALKAFLIGEQHFRRSEWDSALASYQRAVELDSTFALPLYRAGIVLGWQTVAGDSLSAAYLVRAAAHNRGLPPRDSLLILAESLGAAVDEGIVNNPRFWEHYRRLYTTVLEATHRYPRDPEVWYELGEVRYHYPFFATRRGIREALDRAISLDSAYAPAYIHAIEMALLLGDVPAARGYIARYLALRPRDIYADGIRLTQLLLDPQRARSREVEQVLDTASADLLTAALANFRSRPDSAETGVRLARLLAQGRRSGSPLYSDSSFYVPELAAALVTHGRLGEAHARIGARLSWLFAVMAHLGGVPVDTARAVFGRSLRERPVWPPSPAAFGLTWWAAQRDSASLAALAARADIAARTARHPLARPYARYLADAARALITLVRGDTAAAARDLLALPDTACTRCVLVQLLRAQLLVAARLDTLADSVLAREAPGFLLPTNVVWELTRARLAHRRGDRARAAAAYRFVRDAWLNADPVLQPVVREARAALRELGEGP